jgi:tripartite-type tricarboxylate transporter receptor subunit TctC
MIHRVRRKEVTVVKNSLSIARRSFVAGLLAVSAFGGAGIASAQTFPEDTVDVVVAYPPGGSTDLVARLITEELGKALDVSVIVENRPGGGTLVGTQYVVNSKPDGYQVLFATNATVINTLLQKVAYDPVDSFADIGIVTQQSLGVFVRRDLPVNNIQEFIAYAKEHPGEINFASSGNGTNQHMAGEQFKLMAGIDMLHVPYNGAGPALTDLLGGRADVMFTSLYGVTEHVTNGNLKLIATTGTTRNPAAPDTPTVAESGLADYSAISWQGILAPKDTPAEIVDVFSKALAQIATPELSKKLAAQGLELKVQSPADTNAFIVAERDKYAAIIKAIGAGPQ